MKRYITMDQSGGPSEEEATIAAIATPPGEGAVALIRISGRAAWEIAARLFRRGKTRQEAVTVEWFRSRPSYTLHYGVLVDPDSGQILDDILLSCQAAPRTYTGEDCIELNCHGGPLLIQRALEVVLRQGARQARPGEMTRRAFANGRLDLAQAEAIADIIHARSDAGLRAALAQLGGQLSDEVRAVRAVLVEMLARSEAASEGSQAVRAAPGEDAAGLRKALSRLETMLELAGAGLRIRQGVKAVITGRPNVGKSSLLNALLGRDRAIVTPLAGTTRDTVTGTIQLEGIALTLIDTAGITESSDPVERIGVQRSHQAIAEADMILLLVDASQPLSPEDNQLISAILPLAAQRPLLFVLNKADLPQQLDPTLLRHWENTVPLISTSTLSPAGISALQQYLSDWLAQNTLPAPGIPLVTSVRHHRALRQAADHLQAAVAILGAGHALGLVTIDLSSAIQALEEITGEAAGESLLETIFADFPPGT